MLVLSRKENEKLLFPSLGITVEVVRIQGNKARLGIDAPPDIPVLRDEIADLKNLEFTPDENATEMRLSAITQSMREKLAATASSLNSLHRHLDQDRQGQSLVLDVFQQLRELEATVNASLSDDAVEQTPHALLVQQDSTERDLLASCLRFGGFEVIATSNPEDTFGYLSLHACPDFAIIDEREATGDFIDALRSADCGRMRLFGLGEAIGTDRSFPRPINAETLVGELNREFGGRTAI